MTEVIDKDVRAPRNAGNARGHERPVVTDRHIEFVIEPNLSVVGSGTTLRTIDDARLRHIGSQVVTELRRALHVLVASFRR